MRINIKECDIVTEKDSDYWYDVKVTRDTY